MNFLFESKYSSFTPLLQISFCASFNLSRSNVRHGVKMKKVLKDEITAACKRTRANLTSEA